MQSEKEKAKAKAKAKVGIARARAKACSREHATYVGSTGIRKGSARKERRKAKEEVRAI